VEIFYTAKYSPYRESERNRSGKEKNVSFKRPERMVNKR
jgi:hypothetical protein